MPDALLASYEAAPYESNPIPSTQVGSLEAMALLHGMRPPPAERCRVLELGCASGGNIIPMAYRFPNSQFVGVDFAANQIDDGVRTIEALGLANIELRAMSIADIDDGFGLFDYIISHGVYSWVPPDVQDAILRVSSRNLAPNGVAYVSYNVYPGWRTREIMRDMLVFHDDPSLPPSERAARARVFADRLGAAASIPPKFFELVLADEAKSLRGQRDRHLLHEQLESFNSPVYFAEFARRAGGHGLRFVCESKLWMSGWQSQAWVQETTGTDPSDLIRMGQYIDFARGRMFRSSVLCHDVVSVHTAPSPDAIPRLYFFSHSEPAEPAAEDVARGGHVEAFRAPDGTLMTTNNPAVIAALRTLIRASPRALSFAELVSRVQDRLSAEALSGLPGPTSSSTETAAALADGLLQCALGGLVDVDRSPSTCVARASARPRASALARRRAAQSDFVPTLHHRRFEIGAVQRQVLAHLDGEHTRDELVDLLEPLVAAGTITLGDPRPDRAGLVAALESILTHFASAALLEA